jgi:hypothetical protein
MSPPEFLESSAARDVLSASTPPSRPARGRPTFQPETRLATSCYLLKKTMLVMRNCPLGFVVKSHLFLPDHHPEICHRVRGRGLRGHKLGRVSCQLFDATGIDVIVLEILKQMLMF